MTSTDEGSPADGLSAELHAQAGPGAAHQGRGGQRGGRGRGHQGARSDASRGARRGGDRARGSGSARGPRPPLPTSNADAGPRSAIRKLQDARESSASAKPPAGDGTASDDVEAEVCFICASPVVHNSVSPCNHRTCHICALRLRALYKTKACAHCRTNSEFVIFTDDASKRYEDYDESSFAKEDANLGIKYESNDIFEDTVLLLRYNCPDPDCDIACLGWPDLHRHVKSVHHKAMCDLCTRNKKVFTHEHELFTPAELRKHERFGDDNPGAEDQTGFKGHPECGFCRQRFYGDDELYTHCRDKHERCHICDRRNPGRNQQYFLNYDALEAHFRKEHFLCPDQECLEKKFVVFDSEMDLKAHQLEAHPNGLSKDARRDARRVDISTFDYRSPHQQSNRRERDGRGRGRGRDPNIEPIPHSTAQPMRRDELAYQRQMAIQSAQSVSTRTFGGQLTSTAAYAARPPSRAPESATLPAPRPEANGQDTATALASLNLGAPVTGSRSASPHSNQPLTPQEQARRLRHASVNERAANMLQNDQIKIAAFRTRISDFRSSKISANELIDSFFSLFDTSPVELGKLIKELADLFEIDSKRNELLKAWNDWRAVNEDYPALPGPGASTSLPAATTASLGGGRNRVLKLKSSTAQSSRSSVGRQGSWGATSSGNLFPSLPPPSAPTNRARAAGVRTTPWVTPSPSTQPSPASSRASSRPPAKRAPANSSDAFPALPPAAKPQTTIFGYGTGAVRRDMGGSKGVANAWGNGAASGVNRNDPPSSGDVDETTEAIAGGKKKGNKNKKQTLFHFG